MNLVLLGPPGAGKGTQAGVLSDRFKMLHVSTGNILREAVKSKTETGLAAKSYMDKGELVPDQVVSSLIAERISKEDAKNGFILDGFPRNTSQGIELEKKLQDLNMQLDMALYFNTSESTSIARLTGRRVCSSCGLNFHIKNMPSKVEGICDSCGGRLIQRDDDTIDTIKNRLKVYQEQTAPLLSFYRDRNLLKEVSGDLDVNTLFEELRALFKQKKLIG